MKNILLPAAVIVAMVTSAARANVEARWIVDAYPAAFILHTDTANYEITGGNRSDQMSSLSMFPNVGTGAGIETDSFRLDVLGGAGAFINGRLTSLTAYLSGALMYEVSRSARLGPRVGLLYFMEPEWNSDIDVTFDDATGTMLGLNLEMGDKISYVIALDLWMAELEASEATGAYTASEDPLDLTGIALQFGIRGRF